MRSSGLLALFLAISLLASAVCAHPDPSNYIQLTTDMEKTAVKSHKKVEVEHFTDKLDGLTLFRAFRSEIQGFFLRFRKK